MTHTIPFGWEKPQKAEEGDLAIEVERGNPNPVISVFLDGSWGAVDLLPTEGDDTLDEVFKFVKAVRHGVNVIWPDGSSWKMDPPDFPEPLKLIHRESGRECELISTTHPQFNFQFKFDE